MIGSPEWRQKHARKRELTTKDMEIARLPRSLWSAQLDAVSESVALPVRNLCRYVHHGTQEAKGFVVVLVGKAGVGKSCAAAVVAKFALRHTWSVLWTSVRGWREARRRGLAYSTETSLQRRAEQVDLLVLDDLTAKDAEDRYYGWADLLGLVRERSERHRATIITSRVGPNESLGEGSIAELTQLLQPATTVVVEGPDRREEVNESFRGDLYQEAAK